MVSVSCNLAFRDVVVVVVIIGTIIGGRRFSLSRVVHQNFILICDMYTGK